jgi:hypothetical protein
MRIREPKTTALVFASGKVVVTGAKSEDDSRLASRKYARIIQKLGFEAKFQDFKIQNIVGSVSPGLRRRRKGSEGADELTPPSHAFYSAMSSSPFVWRVWRTATVYVASRQTVCCTR